MSESRGASLGNKVRGVWNSIEGVGDSLRGGAMDFVDSATNTGGHHPETDVGAQKTSAGVAQVKGDDVSRGNATGAGRTNLNDSAKVQSAAQPAAGAAPTAGSAETPPLPARGVANSPGDVGSSSRNATDTSA